MEGKGIVHERKHNDLFWCEWVATVIQYPIPIYIFFFISAEDDLDILTALLAENECEEQEEQETKDDLDDLFDDDDDEEYTEGAEEDSTAAAALFGDVDDIEEEEEKEDKKEKNRTLKGQTSDNLNKSKEDLEGW